MIKYYKLFDMLNRNNMKKSDLLNVISSKTIAKLSKGDNVTTDVIDKICLFLKCQPGDIMESINDAETIDENTEIYTTIERNKEMFPEPDTIYEVTNLRNKNNTQLIDVNEVK